MLHSEPTSHFSPSSTYPISDDYRWSKTKGATSEMRSMPICKLPTMEITLNRKIMHGTLLACLATGKNRRWFKKDLRRKLSWLVNISLYHHHHHILFCLIMDHNKLIDQLINKIQLLWSIQIHNFHQQTMHRLKATNKLLTPK